MKEKLFSIMIGDRILFFFLNAEIPSYLPSVTVEQVSTADFSSSLCWALWLKIKEWQLRTLLNQVNNIYKVAKETWRNVT